jgi:methylmalonyl-CoA/ethylmalonyl-CoA epimerase
MSDEGLGTTEILHLSLVVRDIEAKTRAWADIFGWPEPPIGISGPVEDAHTLYNGQSTPARCRQSFFRMGPVTVELIEPVDEPSVWKDQLDQHGDSLHHIGFFIKDMRAKEAYLESKNLRVMQSGDYPGGRYTYMDGVPQLGFVLELLEHL